ncbi:ABC transporter permease [Agrobacterium vitis]|uniref:ABC transporter permease n=1 Tax=Agrobacterium vitis TaxID=373 RepID=UPI0022779E23|nr:ABC transporter permease [Agrobacterium vitis]MCF1467525.1 ABC transporter permease [Agrobacterium vitis]
MSSNGSIAHSPNIEPAVLSVWSRLLSHRMALAGGTVITIIVILSVLGPAINPFDPDRADILHRFLPPMTGGHILGTDELGRDILARLSAGGRISLTIGLLSMLISVVLGTAIGMVAGYRGGLTGAVLMRIVDAIMAFPTIFLVLALALFIKPGIVSTTLLIAATSWMGVARMVEGQYRSLRRAEYAAAAQTCGFSDTRIMIAELLPNAMGAIIVIGTINIARAILLESYVSYLGYGIQAPMASWGNMLNNAQIYLTSAPWLAIVPGLAIALTVTSFNFMGEGLRDFLEPRH